MLDIQVFYLCTLVNHTSNLLQVVFFLVHKSYSEKLILDGDRKTQSQIVHTLPLSLDMESNYKQVFCLSKIIMRTSGGGAVIINLSLAGRLLCSAYGEKLNTGHLQDNRPSWWNQT